MFHRQNYTIRLLVGDPLLLPAACAASCCRMTLHHQQGETWRPSRDANGGSAHARTSGVFAITMCNPVRLPCSHISV